MQIHDYDQNTGEYLQTRQAAQDPEETKLAGEPRYLIPAFAVTEAPPTPGDHQAAVRRAGAWQLVADHRGRAYWLAEEGDAARHVIAALEEELPAGAVWEEDQLQVTLAPDKAVIVADGEDQAMVAVAVAGGGPPADIEIEVDGVPATVVLSNGQGQLPPIVSLVEHVFTVHVADQITFHDGGGCTIAAQEQE